MKRDIKKQMPKQAGDLDPIDFMEQGPGDAIPSNPSGVALLFAGVAIGIGALYLLTSRRGQIADYARDLAKRVPTPEALHH